MLISNKKNYIFTLFSGFGGTAFSTLLVLITVPISLNYWKTDRYGIWVLLTSILSYLAMTNLGLNSSAAVLMAKNPNVRDKIKILRRSFYITLVSVGFVLLSFYILNLFTLNWIDIIGKIPENLKNETRSACIIMVTFYLLSLPISLLSTVYTGFQKVYIENIFAVILAILNFIVLLTVIYLKNNLIFYAFLWGGTLIVFNLVKVVFFYLIIYKKLLEENNHNYKSADNETGYKMVFGTGMRFSLIGIAGILVWNTDNFVISNYIGIQSVAPYFITFKLFSLFFMVISQINGSIMPLLANEYGNKNWDWLNNTYNRLLISIAVIGGASWIGSVLFFRDFITIWSGVNNYGGIYMVFTLGGYAYLFSMVNLNSGIIYAFNYTKKAPLIAWGEAIIKIAISLLLVKTYGFLGVAIGTFLGALLLPTWVFPVWIRRRSLNKLSYDFAFLRHHFALTILPCLVVSVLIQITVSNILFRLLSGVLVVAIYISLSYYIIPVSCKMFYKQNMSLALKRIRVH
jgi:O-antigen/teichoic acid export membrane protein